MDLDEETLMISFKVVHKKGYLQIITPFKCLWMSYHKDLKS